MAKSKGNHANEPEARVGAGGELHQVAGGDADRLTSNQGLVVSDDQNSLRVGPRGPGLLEDFLMREKITHFDHERIPERVVHARGYGAKGYFQAYESHSELTRAQFLQDPSVKTPVFVRFSTVAGSRGSMDTARDVRGFAVKFYTQEGNYDLVSNNIPVFFIQDAIKFPDLIHSVKPEPDREFPQAQSAHDTFWDFVSLNPESMHMLMWVMSDRAIPRSFRMMEGFGVHTFRMINARGEWRFVKFHWRPKLGTISLIWDEAVKVAGADPDFHRRDLWESIQMGDFPEWEFSVQVFDEKQADSFDFDVLDPTKIIPEELVPLTPLGKMVLNENVENFFAETEQVAFCPSHVVPGIDFSNDPLLQGRLFSYLDTQLSRLGSPNFHQIPVNAPKCPINNLQRDGHMQMAPQNSRTAYEPGSLEPSSPRECHQTGFETVATEEAGRKVRLRPESFADHYTQAALFFRSMTEPEQQHIIGGFTFELGKCDTAAVRKRMLGHLELVDRELAEAVAEGLGMVGKADTITPAVQPKESVTPSPALSQYAKAPASIAGRKMAVLTSADGDLKLLEKWSAALKKEQCNMEIVAPTVGAFGTDGEGPSVPVRALAGSPSVVFDGVILAPTESGGKKLAMQADAVDFVRDAFGHLKAIAFTDAARPLLEKAGVPSDADEGLVALAGDSLKEFIEVAKKHRVWAREPMVRPVGGI